MKVLRRTFEKIQTFRSNLSEAIVDKCSWNRAVFNVDSNLRVNGGRDTVDFDHRSDRLASEVNQYFMPLFNDHFRPYLHLAYLKSFEVQNDFLIYRAKPNSLTQTKLSVMLLTQRNRKLIAEFMIFLDNHPITKKHQL